MLKVLLQHGKWGKDETWSASEKPQGILSLVPAYEIHITDRNKVDHRMLEQIQMQVQPQGQEIVIEETVATSYTKEWHPKHPDLIFDWIVQFDIFIQCLCM